MRLRPRLRGERPHEVLTEPARGARDDDDSSPVRQLSTCRFCLVRRRARSSTLSPQAARARPLSESERPARLAFPCAPSRARRRRLRAHRPAPPRRGLAQRHRAHHRRARGRAPPARTAARAGPAHGRGLHARLPRAGAEGRDPEPRFPAPVRTRKPLGARGRVQGVRCLAAERARLRPAATTRDRLRRVRARAPLGPDPGRRRGGHVGAHHHPVRPDRVGMGRRGRPRALWPGRGRGGARRHRRHARAPLGIARGDPARARGALPARPRRSVSVSRRSHSCAGWTDRARSDS